MLGLSNDELSELFRDKSLWPAMLRTLRHTVAADGTVEFDIDVPVQGGDFRRIHVMSHQLPAVPGMKQSYLSLLIEHV